jgi:phospholipid-binding lipoprotein MlaA
MQVMRGAKALLLGLMGLALTACASAPPTPEMIANNDPYEPANRDRLAFNGKIDRYFVVPTVGVYVLLVPEPGKRAVHHFLEHLTLPTTFVNDILQGEFKRGSQTTARFLVNTTLGFGGFLDPASHMKIPDHGEDFGQTLGVWGVDEGPFVMLPFLGPSNPRDAFGLATDIAIDPTNYIHFKQHLWWAAGREYFTVLDLRAQTFQTIQGIQRSSVDYYASLRSFYRQLRESEIRNGRPAKAQDLPDF